MKGVKIFRTTIMKYSLGFGSACLLALMPGVAAQAAKTMPDSMKSAAQVTLGGAKYYVRGEIVNIDGENYWIRKSTGQNVRLKVTDDTNMFCDANKTIPQRRSRDGGGVSDDSQSGFRIGACPPGIGTFVKAETTDQGAVTYLKTIDGNLQSQTERLGLPQNYFVLPLVHDELQMSRAKEYPVNTLDGQEVGTLKRVVIDPAVGTIVYGIIDVDTGGLMPIPWKAMNVPEGGEGPITLHVHKKQLQKIPTFGKDMTVLDIRGYWELSGDEEEPPAIASSFGEVEDTEHYDDFRRLELERAKARWDKAYERFHNLHTRFQDDIEELERERERFQQALTKYNRDQNKTIQQELQSQIFR